MIEIYKLEPHEFGLLGTIEDGYIPDPRNSIALVAMIEGQIVGRMLLIAPAHIEGTWVKEGHRNGRVGLKLLSEMEKRARNCGLSKMFAYAASPEIESYLERLGYSRVPATVWSKDLTCH